MRRAAGRLVARRRRARKRAGGAPRRAGARGGPKPGVGGAPAGGWSVAASTISPRGPARAGGEGGRVRGGDGDDLVRSPCSEGIANFLGDEVAVTAVVEQSAGVVEELADGDPAAVGDEAGQPERSMVSSSASRRSPASCRAAVATNVFVMLPTRKRSRARIGRLRLELVVAAGGPDRSVALADDE